MREQITVVLMYFFIILAIILIIAAIAIPNLMKSKAAANEAGGAATIRTLITDSITYSNSFPAERSEERRVGIECISARWVACVRGTWLPATHRGCGGPH